MKNATEALPLDTGRFFGETFLGSFPTFSQLPESSVPEIALIGRSNVGKSSLINRLFGRRSLAKTSSKPGSTVTFNVFQVQYEAADGFRQPIQFLDLPGFGYAKFSKAKREDLWFSMLEFIEKRDSLRALCLLNDIRREPQAEEFYLRDRCFEAEKHFLVLATKGDTLKRGEQNKRLENIAALYGLEAADLILTGEKISISPLVERLRYLVS
jgi:GTP-binding protein